MEVIGAIASVVCLVQLTSRLIKSVNAHLLREELCQFGILLISLERTLGKFSKALQGSQKETSGLIQSMNVLRTAVDKGKTVVEECQVLSKKKIKVFVFVTSYRKKIESVGLEIERALNGIRNSGVVITVELRESMKETRGLTVELYDKVREILFGMEENQRDILERFDDMEAMLRLVISNGFAKDEEDVENQLQSIVHDADLIPKEKDFMDKVILQKVIDISKDVSGQIGDDKSKFSIKKSKFDHLLKCPLSLDFMEDPVIMKDHTYDREYLCKSLLTYPNLEPFTNTRFDKRASYCDNVAIRQLLMQEKGDAAYKRYDDSSFAEAYEKAWNEFMSGMFLNTAAPRGQINDLYQKIDEYLYGMNEKKIDMEKAYEIIIDAPNLESDTILICWNARFADPRLWGYKSSRVVKNERRANELYRKAVDINIEQMVEDGDQYACACLGWMYENGKGVDQNDSTAVEWYRKAAEQGHADAQYNLGWMYENGKGVDPNDSTAVEWYRKGAEQGLADAQCNLGSMYRNGKGVDENDSTAVEWYRKAAEQGDADAQCNLGLMYEYGEGVDLNYSTAMEWYRKAAEQGHAFAQTKLDELTKKSSKEKKRSGLKKFFLG